MRLVFDALSKADAPSLRKARFKCVSAIIPSRCPRAFLRLVGVVALVG